MSRFIQDLAYAARQLLRAPSFVAAAALTIALGIGANTAIFSVINGFFRPLPVPNADQIVVIAAKSPGDETGLHFKFSFAALQDYRAQANVFSDVFGFDLRLSGLDARGKISPFVHLAVTGNFFTGLGLTPAAGRLLVAGEGEHASPDPVVVLGHSFWRKRFGADPAVVGTTVALNGKAAQIIGVAPEGFRGVMEGADIDGYVPLALSLHHEDAVGDVLRDRGMRAVQMMARMRGGVTIEQAQAAVDVVARDLATRYPDTEKGVGAQVMAEPLARPLPLPFLTNTLPIIRGMLLLLGSIVLAMACMNVANLLLVRATARQREMAVRSALGAGRQRLIRLLLAESVLLALVGGGLGLAVGKWVSDAFRRSIVLGGDFPVTFDFSFDWIVFTYALALAIGTGLLVGILPAFRASRADVTALLHDGGRGSAGPGRQRFRSALVVAQVAGSLALLVVAGLFVRSLREAQRVNLGFDPSHVMTARLDTLHVGYDQPRSIAFFADLERRLSAVPGVESASHSLGMPLGIVIARSTVWSEGSPPAGDAGRPSVGFDIISPPYFTTMGIPIQQGRAFTDRDDEDAARVVIVNETMATRLWPGANPIGKRIEIDKLQGVWEVVGVVGNGKYLAVFEGPMPYFYVPQAQDPTFLRTIQVRSTLSAPEMSARLVSEIAALEPRLPVADLRTADSIVNGNIGFVLFRVGVWQASAMGVVGLVLALVGVYGVVSYRTAQRSREIGIRIALGAAPADVRRLVLGQGAWLVVAGMATGMIAALLLSLTLRRLLVFVSATDPVAFGLVALALAASTMTACYLPARRAMRMPPVEALRHE